MWANAEISARNGVKKIFYFGGSLSRCLGSQTQPFATAKSDISNNTRPFQNLSELGLTKLTYFATSDLNTAEKENFSLIYVKEVIGLFNLVTFPSLLSVSQFKEHGC